jgi:two-component system OmpR family sensor kinase
LTPQENEERELRRTTWRLTVQIAGAITGTVLLVGVLMCLALTVGQRWNAESDLTAAMAGSSIQNPAPAVWMFALEGGVLRGTPNAPAGLPVRSDLGRVAAGGPVLVEERTIGGSAYLVRTERRGTVVLQAAMDLRYQGQERRLAYLVFAVAEIVGLVAAVATGQVLARRAVAPLGEALRRQRRFVAEASHELRTPLTRLHVRAQLLARKTQASGLDDELAALIADTRQFGEVIEDLLMSAQLEVADTARELVDLSAVAESVVSAESLRAQARSVGLDLRRGSGDQLVLGVPGALRRVVGALVDNALNHTRPEGRIEVVVETVGAGREVVLTVRDDGAGFPADQAELIFQRFKGGRGNGRRFGLGLALVREVVENHGGRVTAIGNPGTGAEFTVYLPHATAHRPLTPASPVTWRTVISRFAFAKNNRAQPSRTGPL